ncbi:ABC transporter substrate-binding protein [Peptoclostridium litorale]
MRESNIYARKALAYGMDMDELGLSQIGNQKFWRTGGSLFSKGNIWYDGNAGEGVYNVHDIENAKEMLKKSGYDGTPIVILNGKDDNVESQGAIALKDQLEDIGFNVELQLYDRPTVVEQRSKVDAWNLHLTYFLETNPDPQVFGAWVGSNG